jgi:predicted nucleic acid-binding protein
MERPMPDEKLRLYLDTSIPSACYDTSKPVRQLITQKWFEHDARDYDLHISVVTIEEIDRVRNDLKKQRLQQLLKTYNMTILPLTDAARHLADEYMQKGAIPVSEPEDASHIAIASVHHMDALASWNFSHIVSINPIRKIHEINHRQKLTAIEIGSLEIFGGAKYGNI